METGYHTVSLRVKSVLDSVDVGAEAGGMVADGAADENSTHLSGDYGGSDVSSALFPCPWLRRLASAPGFAACCTGTLGSQLTRSIVRVLLRRGRSPR